MFISRHIELDLSGGSAAGTIDAPVARLAAVFYDFSDASVTGNLTVHALNDDIFTKTGAADSDGVQQVTAPQPVIDGETVVSLASISGGGAGDVADITLYLDV